MNIYLKELPILTPINLCKENNQNLTANVYKGSRSTDAIVVLLRPAQLWYASVRLKTIIIGLMYASGSPRLDNIGASVLHPWRLST